MVKKQPEIQWKSVNFDDPDLISAGLVAFEECTDYNLANVEENPKPEKIKRETDHKQNKQLKKKRKLVETNDGEALKLTPSKSGSSIELDVTDAGIDDYAHWNNYGLPDVLIRGLKFLGFAEPTQIQAATLPAAIFGHRDIVGAAETGSGKTLAFGLPIITGILEHKAKRTEKERLETPLYALILTPTRELAMQVKNHLTSVAKFSEINVAVIVGGMAAVKQERILSKGPEIVVATPGRLWELIQQGNQHLSKITDIKYLVIDETDRMLERGHFEELHDLLERLNLDETKKQNRQNFVFSATLTLVHELPKYLLNKLKKSKNKMNSDQKLQKIIHILGITNPKIVDLSEGGGTSKTLSESRITCSAEEKDFYVYYFLQKHPGRTLIFCNSIGCVKRLANLLNILGCRPLPLHASMQQRQRLKNLERFRDDEYGVLVATDVAARGLDIPKVQHVLHYQTPRTSESYVHRSGRTARASKQGITVLLIEPTEIQNYIKFCKTLQKSNDIPVFPIQDNYLNAVKQRIHLARELDKLELDIRKTNSEAGWLKKAADEMDIIVDDFSKKFDTDDISKKRKVVEIKKKQLAALLAKPLFPKGFSGKYPLNSKDFPSGVEEAEQNDETAVEVLKKSVAAAAKQKKKIIPLFKPKSYTNKKIK